MTTAGEREDEHERAPTAEVTGVRQGQDRPAPKASAASAEKPRKATKRRDRRRETFALVVLSVAAVLTAWSGFQSAQWDGQMSIAFSEASSLQVREAGLANEASAAQQADLTIWALYVQAVATGDDRLAAYVQARFTPHFTVAFEAWVAGGRTAASPFALPEYLPPGEQEARAAAQRSAEKFHQALTENDTGDGYALLTVLFALAIFFAAVSDRPPTLGPRWFLTGVAVLSLAIAIGLLVTYPVLA